MREKKQEGERKTIDSSSMRKKTGYHTADKKNDNSSRQQLNEDKREYFQTTRKKTYKQTTPNDKGGAFFDKKQDGFDKFRERKKSFDKESKNAKAYIGQRRRGESDKNGDFFGKKQDTFDKFREKKEQRELIKKEPFRKHFDKEGEYEKVYANQGRRVKKHIEEAQTAIPNLINEDEQMPLNKFIAHGGICGRREAAERIKAGKVQVNGETIKEPGFKVSTKDTVRYEEKIVSIQKNLVYVLLNKPKGYITTLDDPKGRNIVMDIFKNIIEERIYPVGRLDRNTTGLLLLTNDGQLAQQLSHPKYEVRKIYQILLDKKLSTAHFQQIQNGLELEDGAVKVDQIAYLENDNEVGLEIHSGKNRIVRRIFEFLGYQVEKLDRVVYAGLTKKNLPRGKWRFLNKQEVINLKHLH